MAKGLYVPVERFIKIDLPAGYTQVEYIQSTGTQYIDTLFTPNQDTRVLAEVELKLEGQNYFLFGARRSNSENSSTAATFGFNAYNTTYRAHYYNGYASGDFGTSISFDSKFTIDFNKSTVTLNDKYSKLRTEGNFTCPCTMTIFAVNTNGTVGTYGKAKVYSFKIYDNGVLVRDFVPCVNASDAAGLYDLVHGQFYTNQGTGVFLTGDGYKNGVAKKGTKIYVPVNGISRLGIKGYISIGGVARPFWAPDKKIAYYGSITSLGAKRAMLAATSTKNHAFFGGGCAALNAYSSNAEVYDKSLTRKNISAIGTARRELSAATAGDCAIFCFGNNGINVNNIDAYNASLTQSAPTRPSTKLTRVASASFGNYAIFAGGYDDNGRSVTNTHVYDNYLTKRDVTALSYSRRDAAGCCISSHALFSGGVYNDSDAYRGQTEVYDTSLTKSIISNLSVARYQLAAAGNGTYALFAGGFTSNAYQDAVDAYNASLTRSTLSPLSVKRRELVATQLDGYVIFAGGFQNNVSSKTVDIYDKSLTKVVLRDLATARVRLAATSLGDYALVGGGSSDYAHSSVFDTVEAFTLV